MEKILNEAETQTIDSLIKKMEILLEKHKELQKKWNDPTKWWNR